MGQKWIFEQNKYKYFLQEITKVFLLPENHRAHMGKRGGKKL